MEEICEKTPNVHFMSTKINDMKRHCVILNIGEGKSLNEFGTVPPVNIDQNKLNLLSSYPHRHEWVCVDFQSLGFQKISF